MRIYGNMKYEKSDCDFTYLCYSCNVDITLTTQCVTEYIYFGVLLWGEELSCVNYGDGNDGNVLSVII